MNNSITIKHNVKSLPKADRLMQSLGAQIDARHALGEWKSKAKVAHVSVKRKSIANALKVFKDLNDVDEFYTSYRTPNANYRDDTIEVYYTTK